MVSRIICGLIAAVAVTGGVAAQSGEVRASAGYIRVDVDGRDFDAVAFTLGTDFNEYIGVEGQVDIGVGDEVLIACPAGDICITALTYIEMNYSAGLYAVANILQDEHFRMFARAGYAHIDMDAQSEPTGGDQGLSYGLGAEYLFDGQNGIRADYTRTDFDKFGDADRFSLSYVRRF